MPSETFRYRLNRAIKRGFMGTEPILPGFEIKKTSAIYDKHGELRQESIHQAPEREPAGPIPDNHIVHGVSRLKDSEGRIIAEWEKTKLGQLDPVKVAKDVAAAFDGMKIQLPEIVPPVHQVKDLLTFYPVADWHLGLMAWGKESDIDWDIDIAQRVLRQTMGEVFATSKQADTAILLSAGDLVHADNKENRTMKSGNVLDVDGRYQKVVEVVCDLMLEMALMALQKHNKLIIRILPGNHDEHTAVAVAHFLRAAFRDEPRVTVDTDPSLFFIYPFGDNLICVTHSHTMKPAKLYKFVTSQYRELWGKAKHVYGYVGHFHHREKIAEEDAGMYIEILPAPIPPDAWHYGAGYISGRLLSSYTYHVKNGLVNYQPQIMLKGDG